MAASAQSDHCAMVVKVTFSPSSHEGKIQSLHFSHTMRSNPLRLFCLATRYSPLHLLRAMARSITLLIHITSDGGWVMTVRRSSRIFQGRYKSLINNRHDFYCCQSIINMIFIVAKTQTRGSSDGGIDGKNCWEFEW